MHRYLLALLLALPMAMDVTPALAGELSPEDSAALRKEVQAMMGAFARGDTELIIARTHPSLKQLAGGDEAYARATRDTVKALRKAGVTIISDEAGVPGRTYAAGDEEVCFVPRQSLLRVREAPMRSTSFMVAVRRVGTTQWRYLDGAAMLDNPALLRQLLPALEPGVTLPRGGMEAL
ncbi:hypothetical protein D7U87_18975 [Stenotrophomonas maltophilia]|mgnify:FL=1|uniref:DUF4440 domain-containing protein n=2 Tax=Stenotrophomonas maltophilia group TaxID=995085 RepID=A0AA40YEL2_STEMA|nr:MULTISPECIES: hypothetical protein [Stenotrophomonas]AWB80156.1 hypothetical protein B7H26_20475 [Stenotrophomonas maltophilia]ECH9271605.1 hypothetical protein [Salmonella enterica subsp. enterica serovar Litchfield]KOO85930.1 hypothetical protein VL21_06305 [Stenotrophomonas maltophilia]KUP03171.1 hypothetical protein AR276_17655 [Stenotrophomonas maltophilia]MBA0263774.1 hypothetical protein [Stenotrophomonas maltophilia]